MLSRNTGIQDDKIPEHEKYIVTEVIKEVVHVPARPVGNFRRGMWVMASGRIGIIFSFDGADKAIVHLVNDKGETVESISSKLVDIKQARKREVPKCRWGSIDNFDYQD